MAENEHDAGDEPATDLELKYGWQAGDVEVTAPTEGKSHEHEGPCPACAASGGECSGCKAMRLLEAVETRLLRDPSFGPERALEAVSAIETALKLNPNHGEDGRTFTYRPVAE